MLNSAKPYIRKRAILCLYKIFLKYPDALRPSFPRLKDKLDDEDVAVVSAAVNVICELARKNPKNYLVLAPIFFKLVTSPANNWMLIKVIKLFGSLAPLEPRLAKKLVDPLTKLINNTTAMSLLYECINTATVGLSQYKEVMNLCMEKLRMFVEDQDQNLKYLGLVGMGNIMASHAKLGNQNRDLIMGCLDDEDVTIRLKALELVTQMVSKKNLIEIVKTLLIHLQNADDDTRDDLVLKTIAICSQGGTYKYVTNFQWYISVLVDLTRIPGPIAHGDKIAEQFMDVIIRVKVIRPFGVKNMAKLLLEDRLWNIRDDSSLTEVLHAAAWLCGEYAKFVPNLVETCGSLLVPRVNSLAPDIQAVFVQSLLKLYAFACGQVYGDGEDLIGDDVGSSRLDDETEQLSESEKLKVVEEIAELSLARLPMLAQSVHLEVQERACTALSIIKLVEELKSETAQVLGQVGRLFEEELAVVSAKAARKQDKLLREELGEAGMDLDSWINGPFPDSESEDDEHDQYALMHESDSDEDDGFWDNINNKETDQRKEKRRKDAQAARENTPYILSGESKSSKGLFGDEVDVDSIPVMSLSESDLMSPEPFFSSSQYSDGKKKKKRKGKRKGKHRRDSDDDDEDDFGLGAQSFEIAAVDNGGDDDSDEEKTSTKVDKYAALDVDLSAPLDVGQSLPTIQAYGSGTPSSGSKQDKEEGGKKKKKKHKHKKHKSKKAKPAVIEEEQALISFDEFDPLSPSSERKEVQVEPMDDGEKKKKKKKKKKHDDDGEKKKKKKKKKRDD
eukprot:TRINITY_DN204_c0_g1_i9.p1 TRINITY_DN204_c0_g1~~TRINITY_DN204_c0_g1_i9.p1  ORF type:complete len:787 (-),score=371.76 TRINITY_DN204_c0_g1_i9:131-2491(-)